MTRFLHVWIQVIVSCSAHPLFENCVQPTPKAWHLFLIRWRVKQSIIGHRKSEESSFEHTTINIWYLLLLSDRQIPEGAKQLASRCKAVNFFFAIFCKSTFLAGTVAFNLPRRGFVGQCHWSRPKSGNRRQNGKGNCKRQCKNVTTLGLKCA